MGETTRGVLGSTARTGRGTAVRLGGGFYQGFIELTFYGMNKIDFGLIGVSCGGSPEVYAFFYLVPSRLG